MRPLLKRILGLAKPQAPRQIESFVVLINGLPQYMKREGGKYRSYYWHKDQKWVTWHYIEKDVFEGLSTIRLPDDQAEMYHAQHKKTNGYPPDHTGNP